MAYTYTERKRIRKNFGNRDAVLEIPYLLQMQKDAYTAFLQAEVAPKKRTVEQLVTKAHLSLQIQHQLQQISTHLRLAIF